MRWNFELDAKLPLKMREVSAVFFSSSALPVEKAGCLIPP